MCKILSFLRAEGVMNNPCRITDLSVVLSFISENASLNTNLSSTQFVFLEVLATQQVYKETKPENKAKLTVILTLNKTSAGLLQCQQALLLGELSCGLSGHGVDSNHPMNSI